MPDLFDESENVSVHGILNWILLLFIFSPQNYFYILCAYKQHKKTKIMLAFSLNFWYYI